MPTSSFLAAVKRASDVVRSGRWSNVALVYHDDADGLSSAAILVDALEKLGLSPRLICLERLSLSALRLLHKESFDLLIYADIASPHADLIEKMLSDEVVVILDHHNTSYPGSRVLNVNPELHGFRGEVDASGSIVAYLFAKELVGSSLPHIALIGAHELPRMDGVFTKLVFDEALSSGEVKKSGKQLLSTSLGMPLSKAFSMLQVLGPVGYYRGGPEAGIKALLEGFSSRVAAMVESFRNERKKAFKRLIAILARKGLSSTDSIQYFNAGRIFKGMGSKVIGSFCSMLSNYKLVDQDKYLLGVMELEPLIPGLGEHGRGLLKASMRAPRELRRRIESGDKPPISLVISAAAKAAGELGDGHDFAGSAILLRGMLHRFLEEAERKIAGWSLGKGFQQ
ncbi:MAG: hypothetical protein DRN99_00405 [Thermoproteota archaeon]|nr:MAG: hypothetical protein DRN99_00405 [Candidatus Korarchaeota archaeon]